MYGGTMTWVRLVWTIYNSSTTPHRLCQKFTNLFLQFFLKLDTNILFKSRDKFVSEESPKVIIVGGGDVVNGLVLEQWWKRSLVCRYVEDLGTIGTNRVSLNTLFQKLRI